MKPELNEIESIEKPWEIFLEYANNRMKLINEYVESANIDI